MDHVIILSHDIKSYVNISDCDFESTRTSADVAAWLSHWEEREQRMREHRELWGWGGGLGAGKGRGRQKAETTYMDHNPPYFQWSCGVTDQLCPCRLATSDLSVTGDWALAGHHQMALWKEWHRQKLNNSVHENRIDRWRHGGLTCVMWPLRICHMSK